MYTARVVEIDSAEENNDIQAESNRRCAIHVWLGIADKYWEGHWTVQSTLGRLLSTPIGGRTSQTMVGQKNTAPICGMMVTGMILCATLPDGEMVEIGQLCARSKNIFSWTIFHCPVFKRNLMQMKCTFNWTIKYLP